MSGWHCDKCAPGWPLLESRQRGGREYWAGTPFKLSSKSCTNSERITLQAWWRRWWSWRWWCWWWWWEQEDGGGSVLIIWCDIFFQPHWSLHSGWQVGPCWGCNPIPIRCAPPTSLPPLPLPHGGKTWVRFCYIPNLHSAEILRYPLPCLLK